MDRWQLQGGLLHQEGLGSKAVPLKAVARPLPGDREKAVSEPSMSPSPHCCCVLPLSKWQFQSPRCPCQKSAPGLGLLLRKRSLLALGHYFYFSLGSVCDCCQEASARRRVWCRGRVREDFCGVCRDFPAPEWGEATWKWSMLFLTWLAEEEKVAIVVFSLMERNVIGISKTLPASCRRRCFCSCAVGIHSDLYHDFVKHFSGKH